VRIGLAGRLRSGRAPGLAITEASPGRFLARNRRTRCQKTVSYKRWSLPKLTGYENEESLLAGVAFLGLCGAAHATNAQNTVRYGQIYGAILTERNDDIQRNCFDIRDKTLAEMKAKGTDTLEAIRFIYHHFDGECAAEQGWDNFNAPDSHDQYSRIIHGRIRAVWGRRPKVARTPLLP
jgi:hypothetical protein